jgi:uncharacterized membrane protein YidH (DUF202 family)
MINILKIISQVRISESEIDIPLTEAPDGSSINTVLQNVFLVGAGIAMIVIILAGIQFILSQGDPGKTAKARNTIIYAAIGLVLCALAFSIVRFVLGKIG